MAEGEPSSADGDAGAYDVDDADGARDDTGGTYTVGYGRPLRHTRFQPGQSGNPRGRPKQAKTVSAMLREIVVRPVTITENGRKKTVTWLEAMLLQIGKGAIQGDGKATDRVLRLLPMIEAALAEAAGGGGPGGLGGAASGAGGSAFGGDADRAILAYFADQAVRGEWGGGEEAGPAGEVPGSVDEAPDDEHGS